jgi:hypothetical protein
MFVPGQPSQPIVMKHSRLLGPFKETDDLWSQVAAKVSPSFSTPTRTSSRRGPWTPTMKASPASSAPGPKNVSGGEINSGTCSEMFSEVLVTNGLVRQDTLSTRPLLDKQLRGHLLDKTLAQQDTCSIRHLFNKTLVQQDTCSAINFIGKTFCQQDN